MKQCKISFEDMPRMLGELIDQVNVLSKNMVAVKELSERNIALRYKTIDGRRVLSTEELCVLLNRKRGTIYKMVARGELPCIKQGNTLAFYEDDIQRWLEAGRRLTTDELLGTASAFLENSSY